MVQGIVEPSSSLPCSELCASKRTIVTNTVKSTILLLNAQI